LNLLQSARDIRRKLHRTHRALSKIIMEIFHTTPPYKGLNILLSCKWKKHHFLSHFFTYADHNFLPFLFLIHDNI
jgi:hypothetical protein